MTKKYLKNIKINFDVFELLKIDFLKSFIIFFEIIEYYNKTLKLSFFTSS